jgi:hypothetical protein
MPFYVKVGKVPPKRHTTFYKEDGKSFTGKNFSVQKDSQESTPTNTIFICLRRLKRSLQ